MPGAVKTSGQQLLVGLPMMVSGMLEAVAVAGLEIVTVVGVTATMEVVAGMPVPEMPSPAARPAVVDSVTWFESWVVEPVMVTVSATLVARVTVVAVVVALLESVTVLVVALADGFIAEMVVLAGMPGPVTPSPMLRPAVVTGAVSVTVGEPEVVAPAKVMVVAVAALERFSVVALVIAAMVALAGMPGPEIGSPAARPVVLETVTAIAPWVVVAATVCEKTSVPTRQLPDGAPIGMLVGTG